MKLGLKVPSVGGIFNLKKTSTGLSVQITDKILRVLELDQEKNPVFEPVEELWEHEGEEEKKKILADIIASNKLKGKEVATCISTDEGILKYQKFPAAMSKKELNDAIEWYIKSETQQIKEETIYDYYFLDRDMDDKYIKVVITIARKNSVDRLVSLLKDVGLQPKIVDYEIVSVINYGLLNNFPPPFSILYIDYHEGVLTYYGKNTVSYNKIDFNYKYYQETKDPTILDAFLIEVRNQLVINEISNIYLAGAIIGDEQTLENIMMNLPVLGILDLEKVPPGFFVPYILSVRALEE